MCTVLSFLHFLFPPSGLEWRSDPKADCTSTYMVCKEHPVPETVIQGMELYSELGASLVHVWCCLDSVTGIYPQSQLCGFGFTMDWKICPKGSITINYSKYVGHWQSQVLSHCIEGQSITFLCILFCAVLWSELMIFFVLILAQHGIEYHWGVFF